jgi:tetratricopeptide (TPR) repeat protein
MLHFPLKSRQIKMISNQPEGKRDRYAAALIAALFTAVVYLPLLRNGFVFWDDNEYIIENLHIRHLDWPLLKWSFTAIVLGNWHPLTNLAHALDYALWGLNPLGHHLSGIIIHSVNTFLVVLLCRRILALYGKRVKNAALPVISGPGGLAAAFTAGLLFGIHPLHVESVAWASERKDLLCGLFYLLAMISYLNRVATMQPPFAPGISWRSYLPAFFFFLLALMSKPMAVTLPLVLLLLDRYLLQRIDSFRTAASAVIEKLPFFLAALILTLFTLLTFVGKQAGELLSPEEFVPMSGRILVACRAFFAYLVNMLFPVGLTPIYPYPQAAGITITSPVYFFPVSAAVILLLIIIRNLRTLKWCHALWLYYLVTLLPVLSVIRVGRHFMADRYTYLPSLAPFLAFGIACSWLWLKLPATRTLRRIAVVTACCVTVALVSLTLRQMSFWRESTVFWTHVIETEPKGIPYAYVNRALVYRENGDHAKAFADLNMAIELEPGYLGYNNRGLLFIDAGQPDKAIADFNRAISFLPQDQKVYINRGCAYWKKGERGLALADFNKALSINPEDITALNNRGKLLQELGEVEKAMLAFNMALAIYPDSWMTYNNRGLLFAAKGELDSAINDYNRAARLNPAESSIFASRGLAQSAKGEVERALADFDTAIRLKPDDSRVYNNRAIVYAGKGELTAALNDFTKALEIDPSLAAAHLNRGIILLKSGDETLARKDLADACSLGVQAGCDFLKNSLKRH